MLNGEMLGMSEFEAMIQKLISLPLRGQIEIDFNAKEKHFQVLAPIFKSKKSMPQSVKEYVVARKGHIFKPHATFFQMDGEERVLLIQQIPFSFSPALREEVDHFWQIARHMHRILSEIAIEEKFKAALDLDADFPE